LSYSNCESLVAFGFPKGGEDHADLKAEKDSRNKIMLRCKYRVTTQEQRLRFKKKFKVESSLIVETVSGLYL
jgi:hypothetical protein